MGLTRFKDARSDKDGPVTGGLIVIPVTFDAGVTNTTYAKLVDLPAGMNIELVAINVRAASVAGNPQLTVGTSAAGTQIAAAATLTTNLGALTLKSTAVTDLLEVRIVDDASADVFTNVVGTIVAYVSAPPTSLLVRGSGHY